MSATSRAIFRLQEEADKEGIELEQLIEEQNERLQKIATGQIDSRLNEVEEVWLKQIRRISIL